MSKTTFENPVTGATYETKEELVDAMVESYNKMMTEKHNVAKDEEELLNLFDELCENPTKLKGAVHVMGHKNKVTVTRKENVRYEYERGDEHPLRALVREYPAEMENKVKLSYSEQGSEIDKFLAADNFDPSEMALRQKILDIRAVSAGKPSVKVKELA